MMGKFVIMEVGSTQMLNFPVPKESTAYLKRFTTPLSYLSPFSFTSFNLVGVLPS